MSGWIKLHRSMQDHWLYSEKKYSDFQAWIDLLIHANYKDKKVKLKGRLIDVKRGQQVRSELTLAKEWGWSRNKVRAFLLLLQSDNMIEQQKNNLTTCITIINYDQYQEESTPEGTAKGHQKVHNIRKKEVKERKKDIDVEQSYVEIMFDDFWKVYDRKVGRVKAFEYWKKKIETIPQATDVIKCAKAYAQATEKQYRKHPERWLRDECWNDEVVAKQSNHIAGEEADNWKDVDIERELFG